MENNGKIRLSFMEAYLKVFVVISLLVLCVDGAILVWVLKHTIPPHTNTITVSSWPITIMIYIGLLGGPILSIPVALVVKKYWRLPKKYKTIKEA